MLLRVWRRWTGRTIPAPRRGRSLRSGRTPLRVEYLETRDLLTTFAPFYVLNPATAPAAPMATTGAGPYTPSQISHAYGFDKIAFNSGMVAGNGAGQTIAIVDAGNDPTISSDLHTFDQQFGLPDPVFTKVNQNGGSTMPSDQGWSDETALDVEWAHAIAPAANILLVEANSASYSDLFTAVNYAANQPGVSVVSMSWGGGEWSGQSSYDSVFANHPGVAFVASAGDSGAPVSYPATSPNVLSVGGTSLYLDASGNYSSEAGWSGSGGGTSTYENEPQYQQSVQQTGKRTNPDVSYNADPNTGTYVYNSDPSNGYGWEQIGGTSAGAPQWAALVAIADQGRKLAGEGTLGGSTLLSDVYNLSSADFHDVATGTSTGTPNYTAGAGYDLVTGRGSPIANLVVAGLVGQSTPVAATHFVLTTSTTSPTGGTPFSVTVKAEDANGNVVTGYTGTVHFTSTDSLAVLPADYTFNSGDAGIHTFSVTLKTAGGQTLTAADRSNASLYGSTSVTVSPPPSPVLPPPPVSPPAPSTTVIEGFETPDSWYVGGYTSPTAYQSPTAAHNGTYGLAEYNGWMYRNDAGSQVKAGDTLSVWLQFYGTANGQASFGFGSSSNGTLALVASPSTGQLSLQLVGNNYTTTTNLASVHQTFQAGHWYRLEVDWGAHGTIVGKLFDSNGTTLLNQVSATTTAITSGGIAFRATGYYKLWDTVTDRPGVNTSFAAPKAVSATGTVTGGQSPFVRQLVAAPASSADDAFHRRIAALDQHFASDSAAMGYSRRFGSTSITPWLDAEG